MQDSSIKNKKYRFLYFDLDSTLWDYENNAAQALSVLFAQYKLDVYFNFFSHFNHLFFKYNEQLWDEYREGKIDKDFLRTKRFELCFNDVGQTKPELSIELNNEFLKICPRSEKLIPGTIDILEYLKEKKYRMFIITNGFTHIQKLKIKHSGIEGYFERMFTSDSVGAHKPNRSMFEYCIKTVNARKTECLMIGDNLKVDIIGAKKFGIDHVYFNPNQTPHNESLTYEITHLSELRDIL